MKDAFPHHFVQAYLCVLSNDLKNPAFLPGFSLPLPSLALSETLQTSETLLQHFLISTATESPHFRWGGKGEGNGCCRIMNTGETQLLFSLEALQQG